MRHHAIDHHDSKNTVGMTNDSPDVRESARLYFVDAATGAITPIDAPIDARAGAPLEDVARRLDEALGRVGLSYRSHPRNPMPGQSTGYYVYEDGRAGSDAAERADDHPTVRDFVVVGFVEVIPAMDEATLPDAGRAAAAAPSDVASVPPPLADAGVEPAHVPPEAGNGTGSPPDPSA